MSLAASCVVLVSAGPVFASGAPRVHDGLYIHGEIMAGPSWLNYEAPINTDMPHEGTATGPDFGVLFAMGWTLPAGLVLGGTTFINILPEPDFSNAAVKQGWDDTSGALVGLAAYARFYPNPRGGFHIEGLVGAAYYRVRQSRHIDGPLSCPPFLPDCVDEHTSTLELTEKSGGYVAGFGAGYELWLSRRFSAGLTARFGYAHTWSGSNRYTLLLPAAAIGMTWN